MGLATSSTSSNSWADSQMDGTKSYYNLDLPSVCLSGNSSAVYRPIGTKLGRKVEDGPEERLRALVSMATKLLAWQP